ncbi:hypothetical protein CAEBREN_06111 [Caenorhabditis brenneri]|uniref:histone acetyltransferase n=1 Tax=Caenorhabditis brenneri TaxID=135651 RepID=G0NEB4_CAEBE|nr:hypothetical protein CAEBREN_06111 [Caenorhabditis brenneri]
MSASSSDTNSPSPPGQLNRMEEHKRQLVMLFHAKNCNAQPCTVSHCADFKNIWNHMINCRAGENCTVTGCALSRSLMIHYKNCQNGNCGICAEVRKAQGGGQNWRENLDPRILENLRATFVGTLTTCLPPPAGPDVLNPNSILQATFQPRRIETQIFNEAPSLLAYLVHIGMLIDVAKGGEPASKPWHEGVKFPERVRCVIKMMEALLGAGSRSQQRINGLVSNLKEFERELYSKANSSEEYLHGLQNKAVQMKASQ